MGLRQVCSHEWSHAFVWLEVLHFNCQRKQKHSTTLSFCGTTKCGDSLLRKRTVMQSKSEERTLPSKLPKWTPVDVDTMKELSMGIIRLPSRHNYWRQNKFMFVTSFNNIMSRDRFDLIWRYLHLHDNETPEVAGQHDKLKKIRWLVPWLFEQEISI